MPFINNNNNFLCLYLHNDNGIASIQPICKNNSFTNNEPNCNKKM